MSEFIGNIERFEELRHKLIAGLSKCKESKTKGGPFEHWYYFEDKYLKDLSQFIGMASDLRNMFDKPFDCVLCKYRKADSEKDEPCRYCLMNMQVCPTEEEFKKFKMNFTPIGVK